MSNIGIALQLLARPGESTDTLAQRCGLARQSGFDYLLLGCPPKRWTEIPHLQQSTAVKIIGLQTPLAHVMDAPGKAIQRCADLGVPDLVLDFQGQSVSETPLQELQQLASPANVRLSCLLPAPLPPQALIAAHWCAVPDAAALDAPALIRRFVGHAPLVLLNDVVEAPDTPFGAGALDWEATFDAGEEAAAEWYVVGANSVQWERPETLRSAYAFLAARA